MGRPQQPWQAEPNPVRHLAHGGVPIRPVTPPMTGRNTSATISDAVSTKISVTGSIPMNSPATPGQNSMGKNAQSVVAVEAMTGQNMRSAART